MRVIKEISYPKCKASIFYMNQKYIIKFENGSLEQAYKISELDYLISNVSDIEQIINQGLLQHVDKIFDYMNDSLLLATENFQ
jgi:hypothetical protein